MGIAVGHPQPKAWAHCASGPMCKRTSSPLKNSLQQPVEMAPNTHSPTKGRRQKGRRLQPPWGQFLVVRVPGVEPILGLSRAVSFTDCLRAGERLSKGVLHICLCLQQPASRKRARNWPCNPRVILLISHPAIGNQQFRSSLS